MEYNVEVNFDANKIKSLLERKVQKKLDFLANKALNHAKNSQAYKGNVLRKNIKIRKPNNFTRTVYVNVPWGRFVEYGNNSAGEYIYPKRAKALKFVIGGKTIFTKKAKTYSGRFFMKAAKEYAIKFI